MEPSLKNVLATAQSTRRSPRPRTSSGNPETNSGDPAADRRPGLLLEIDIRERLAAAVTHDKARF